MSLIGQHINLILDLDRGSTWEIISEKPSEENLITVTLRWIRGRHDPYEKTMEKKMPPNYTVVALTAEF